MIKVRLQFEILRIVVGDGSETAAKLSALVISWSRLLALTALFKTEFKISIIKMISEHSTNREMTIFLR